MAYSLGQLQKKTLRGFVALGPLGNLLTPHLISHAFRTYYLILFLFPLFYITPTTRKIKILAYSIPFFAYCFISALFVDGSMPLFRSTLLLFQFLFSVGASFILHTEEEALDLITLYLKSFFLSLAIGYVGYVGYYLNFLPFPLLERFSVLTQIGYGFLRFSPGSYPNEYGIMCSFILSMLTYKLLSNTSWLKFSKKTLLTLFFFITIALLLTTTRAAYLSYAFALTYLAWKKGRLLQVFFTACALFLAIFLTLSLFGINMFKIFAIGFSLANFESGSVGDRITSWLNSFELFKENPLWGTGFGTQPHLHNLYFQILFELGICGLIILAATLSLHLLNRGYIAFGQKVKNEILDTMVVLGLIHVVWFALTNHNLNHHLSWFVLFLTLTARRLKALPQIAQIS
jgi:O-antigen ligase